MKRYMESHGILSEHKLVFMGPEGEMTLEEAYAKGYEVRHYMHQGMLAPHVIQRNLGAGMSLYELENRNQRDYERQLAAQMQNSPALRYAKSQEPGGLEAGPAKHMGVPCEMPRPGWRERVRQWRRR